MWSMWNAPSDRDYYGQHGFGGGEPEPEEELEEEKGIDPEMPDEESGEQQ